MNLCETFKILSGREAPTRSNPSIGSTILWYLQSRLEKLKLFSVRINDQWGVIFGWVERGARSL